MSKKRIRLDKPVTGTESLDLIVRKILMCCVLYYGLGISIVSDDQFDKWCKHVAKHWYRLERYRQWQLGSPEQIRTTGYHCRISTATIYGALSWLGACGIESGIVYHTQEWKWSKRYKVHYLAPENFAWKEKSSKKNKDPIHRKPNKRRVRL